MPLHLRSCTHLAFVRIHGLTPLPLPALPRLLPPFTCHCHAPLLPASSVVCLPWFYPPHPTLLRGSGTGRLRLGHRLPPLPHTHTPPPLPPTYHPPPFAYTTTPTLHTTAPTTLPRYHILPSAPSHCHTFVRCLTLHTLRLCPLYTHVTCLRVHLLFNFTALPDLDLPPTL